KVWGARNQAMQLGPHSIALIGSGNLRHTLIEHALHLADGRHDAVDVRSIMVVVVGPASRPRDDSRSAPGILQLAQRKAGAFPPSFDPSASGCDPASSAHR